jgi:predicted nucleotidyltransferase
MESRTIPPPQASARQTEMGDKFNRVLFSALDALQANEIPYALIGGIAASGLGRPRSTHDIDIFVRPEDAEAALESLGKSEFETDRTDPRWLFKGWKDEMMVDIIFKSQGDIYFDSEMQNHVRLINYHGRNIPAVAPEDLVIIKAAVHAEVGPHHWHDALAILSHAQVDWVYLLKRARRAPRRLLSLLIYAQSNDILIPNNVILELHNTIFGSERSHHTFPTSRPTASELVSEQTNRPWSAQASLVTPTKNETHPPVAKPDAYLTAHLLEKLATDPRTAAADVQMSIAGRRILVKGEMPSQEHRNAVDDIIRDHCQDAFDVDNQIRVTEIRAPEVEEVV